MLMSQQPGPSQIRFKNMHFHCKSMQLLHTSLATSLLLSVHPSFFQVLCGESVPLDKQGLDFRSVHVALVYGFRHDYMLGSFPRCAMWMLCGKQVTATYGNKFQRDYSIQTLLQTKASISSIFRCSHQHELLWNIRVSNRRCHTSATGRDGRHKPRIPKKHRIDGELAQEMGQSS